MWISKKLKMLNVWGIYLKYCDSQTNKQNTIILTYKELHGTCIKSKKQHIYSIFQISQQKFSKLNVSPHQVCRKFDPFYRQPPIWSFPPWCIFTNSPIFTTFFWQYRPNDIRGKHRNKNMRESYFFMFRRLQNNVTLFFYKQHFYVSHQSEISFELITVSWIKGI